MKSGVPWQVQGVGRQARETAQEAARRAGMSVGEWLDNVIIGSAEKTGIATAPMRAADAGHYPPYPDFGGDSQPEDYGDAKESSADHHSDTQSLQEDPRGNRRDARPSDPSRDERAAGMEMPRAQEDSDHDERQRRIGEDQLAEVNNRLATLGRQLDELARANAAQAVRVQAPAPAPTSMPMSIARPQREPEPSRRLVEVISRLDNKLNQLIDGGRNETLEIERRLREVDNAIASLGSGGGQRSPAADPATSLDQALIEIAERQRALDGETTPRPDLPRAPTQNLSGLEQQLRQINSRIETLRPCGIDAAIETLRDDLAEIGLMVKEAMPRRAIEALESEVRSLAHRLDSKRHAGVDDTALAGLERGLAEVRDALRALTPAESLVGLDDAVRTLAHKIDGVAAGRPDPAAIEQLEGAIAGLRGVVSHVASNEALDTLSQEVRTLAAKVDQMPSFDVLATLEHRIGAMADALQARHQKTGEDARELELVVQGFTDKLERLQLTRADHAAVVHLEDRIARLVEKLDASDARLGHLESIERGLAELLIHIEHQRTPKSANGGPPAPEVDTLKRDVQRTQDSIEAVHSTLGHLVDRLAAIEAGLREEGLPKPASAPEHAAPAPASRAAMVAVSSGTAATTASPRLAAPTGPAQASAAAAAGAAVAAASTAPPAPPVVPAAAASGNPSPATVSERRPIDPTLPPDTPLEPGATRGRSMSTPAERIAASEAALGPAKPPVIPDPAGKSNFISAARRAAQAANAEAAIRPDNRVPATGAKPAKPMGERVRSLLVGTSVVLIVLGSLHLAANLLFSSGEPQTPTQEEAAPPAPAGAPEGAADSPSATPAALPTPATPPESTAPTAPAAPKPGRQSILLPGANSIPFATPAAGIVTPPATAIGSATPPPSGKIADDNERVITGSVPQPAPAPLPPRAPARAPVAEKSTETDKLPASIGSGGLRAAAVRGDPGAEYEIALRYADGRGVPRNLTEAAVWFERAAKHGLVPAQFRLGGLYEKGLGVQKNIETARRLYTGAAEAGNPKAMHNLAVLYAEGIDGKPDYQTAALWFRKAADYGVTDSQYNLGILYARGIGVQVNLAEAYKWFTLASREGDKEAAKKRDDVGSRLDQQSLMAARAAAQAWTAGSPPEAAVEPKAPAGGWDAVPSPSVAKRHVGPKS